MNEMNNGDDEMNNIIKIIKDSYHPTSEELGNLILYQNGIELEEKSFLKLTPKIEDHLRKCSECKTLFLELNAEYEVLNNFLKQEAPEKEVVNVPLTIFQPRKYFRSRYPVITLLLVVIIYLGAVSIYKIITPSYLNYASIENRSDIYETRGRATYDFQESLKALEKKDNESAVNWLNKDIINNKGDETIFYSYYSTYCFAVRFLFVFILYV